MKEVFWNKLKTNNLRMQRPRIERPLTTTPGIAQCIAGLVLMALDFCHHHAGTEKVPWDPLLRIS